MIKIIVFLFLLIGLGAGVYLIQHQTFLKPKATESAVLEKGFQINNVVPIGVPSTETYDALKPQWIRFVYRPDKGFPDGTPGYVKKLAIFNYESVPNSPLGKTDLAIWKQFTDNNFIPALITFLDNDAGSDAGIDAIEVWNEEDICPSKQYYCPYVPPAAFAYMMKRVADEVSNYATIGLTIPYKKPSVIIGGLASGSTSYLKAMKKAEPDIFTKVDGFGLHPYTLSPDGWCAKKAPECNGKLLPNGDLAQVIQEHRMAADNLPVWVTEIGYGTEDKVWQATFFDKAFEVMKNNDVRVAFWYSFADIVMGGSNDPTWGLIDLNSNIKPVGTEFRDFK